MRNLALRIDCHLLRHAGILEDGDLAWPIVFLGLLMIKQHFIMKLSPGSVADSHVPCHRASLNHGLLLCGAIFSEQHTHQTTLSVRHS